MSAELGQGLLFTLVGMLVTFTGLGSLALVMWGIGRAESWRERQAARAAQREAEGRYQEAESRITPELVAVILAAVEEAAGRPVRLHRVRYLREVPEEDAAWSRAGRFQVMGSHAVVRRSR